MAKLVKHICKDCGVEFEAGTTARYCPECRKKRMRANVKSVRRCMICGKEFIGTPGALYCLECRKLMQRVYYRKHMQRKQQGAAVVLGETVRKCPFCGRMFVVMNVRQRYCTACAKEAHKFLNRRHDRIGAERKRNRETKQICKECGIEFVGNAKAEYCPACMKKHLEKFLEKETPRHVESLRFCADCGKELPVGSRSRYCPECRRKRHCESSHRYMERKREKKALQPAPPTRLSILREQRSVSKEKEQKPKKVKTLKRTKKCICEDCGKEFIASPGARYCPECRKKRMQSNTKAVRRCTICGKEFVGGPRSLYCQECGIKKRRERWRHYMERRKAGKSIVLGETMRKCEACGKPFVMIASGQKYCPECIDKITQLSHPPIAAGIAYHTAPLVDRLFS